MPFKTLKGESDQLAFDASLDKDLIFIPNGTIAQLGERATEVRKVAGSIPARPITQLGERATEVRKVAGSIPARPIMFLHFSCYQGITVSRGVGAVKNILFL
ncbi:hypothetical protein N7471_001485 [Penicillium samsonianum]|uniref:uncharacterized protein n=1 Tax=Penicillium samsonianum TaxID=1882272 RepID=UPI0025494EBD|nr:uncharacterized protein N7471_001485 [Penicillium samsonianum]KAJ6150286.1 hypothetical protein N7471_001485 [Penicillium samsonianum]